MNFFNSLHINHFWVINEYIILEENTLLNFTSNLLGKALIKIEYPAYYTPNDLPSCPIQYVSYKDNVSKEFTSRKTLNFSLIFHGHLRFTVKFILGKTLKDCDWLPESAFTASHPGMVSKQIL